MGHYWPPWCVSTAAATEGAGSCVGNSINFSANRDRQRTHRAVRDTTGQRRESLSLRGVGTWRPARPCCSHCPLLMEVAPAVLSGPSRGRSRRRDVADRPCRAGGGTWLGQRAGGQVIMRRQLQPKHSPNSLYDSFATSSFRNLLVR